MFLQGALDESLKECREILESVKDPIHDDWDPLKVGLLISKLEYPELDINKEMADFAVIINKCREQCPPDLSVRDQTQYLSKFFSDTLEFKGDQSNYYNFKNSLIKDVLLRRKGIPVSLSLVYMALARGLGLRAVGINFPGHFLVQIITSDAQKSLLTSKENVSDWMKTWYVDCFDGGKLLFVEDCERRLREWTRGVIPFTPEVLKISHPVEIVSRLLRNLKAIFQEKEDYARLYWVLTALLTLCPQDAQDSYRERGLLMGRMGRFRLAVADLKKYLEGPSDPSKMDHVQRLLRHFESQSEMVN